MHVCFKGFLILICWHAIETITTNPHPSQSLCNELSVKQFKANIAVPVVVKFASHLSFIFLEFLIVIINKLTNKIKQH
jgi:hypothetical protein